MREDYRRDGCVAIGDASEPNGAFRIFHVKAIGRTFSRSQATTGRLKVLGAVVGGIVWIMQSREVKPAAPHMARLAGDELVQRRVRVKPSDVVLVKGLCEASEGL